MSIHDCRLVDFPKVTDRRGNLSFIEGGNHIPFEIRRVYYLYDVPGGESRGGHAHKALEQVIIAINGSFDVELDDGFERRTVHLRRANEGLYVNRLIWRELTNFTSGSVALVLASTRYSADDYYRDFEEFKAAARAARG
jgi:hypothetical protein